MSDELFGDEHQQVPTPKEGAETRISLSTTAHPGSDSQVPKADPEKKLQDVRTVKPEGTNILMEASSSLEKLQTYLPTGTWVLYTALQTWAFGLRPNAPPTSATSNCNSHQRIALIIVICLSAFLAFLSCFVKRFVYDSAGAHVLYPAPDDFSVAHPFTDHVTGAIFPCRTAAKRYCWPLVDDLGELIYDDKDGQTLRVLVFRPGVKIHVWKEKSFKRMWNSWSSWLNPEDKVAKAPRLRIPPIRMSGGISVRRDIDAVASAPPLQPRWTYTLVGSFGSKAYLDLSPSVWAHALVCVLAFFTLALFSTQVTGCIYPSVPDYLPPTVQTAMLVLLSLIATLFIRDDTVSLGQRMPGHVPISSQSEVNEVPVHLREVHSMLVWISREDVLESEGEVK